MKLVKNNGYKKPTKEQYRTAMLKAEERKREYLLNHEDIEKEAKEKAVEEQIKITKAFDQYLDNLKLVLKFMDEQRMDYVNPSFHDIDTDKRFVRYPFGTYKIFGKSLKEARQEVLNNYKTFMQFNDISEFQLQDPNEDFTYLLRLTKQLAPTTDQQHLQYTALLQKIYGQAVRLKTNYSAATDKGYFVPEFIVQLPEDKLDLYFYLHLITNNLCDGIMDPEDVDPELRDKLHWKYYPVIMVDPFRAEEIRNRIAGALTFIENNNQYFL